MWRRFGKRQVADAVEEMGSDAAVRVKRPGVTAFMLGGGFHGLPVVNMAAFSSPARRLEECQGWTLPDADLGRKKVASASTAESVRLWIEKNLGHYCGEDVRDYYSVTFDPDGAVRIYRRA